jgi:hypothetical protein
MSFTPIDKKNKASRQISILRALLLVTIVMTGILSGGLSYYFIRKNQMTLFNDHFNAMAQDHFKSVKKSFELQLQANFQIATIMGWACPSVSDWPSCDISSREFISRAKSLSVMTEIPFFEVAPIVHPKDRKSFEEFAFDYYQKDGGYQNGTGISDFGPGIFDFDVNYQRTKSPNHTNPTTSQYDFLAPILYASDPSLNYFLADAYTIPIMKPVIEEILGCQTSLSTNKDACSSITSFIPAGLEEASTIVSPIFPANDPETVVGFSGAVFSWETLLSATLQNDFNLQCLLQSNSDLGVRTYSIKNGEAHETTGITHYSASADHFWRQPKVSFLLAPDGVLSSETTYTITYYSSNNAPPVRYAAIACGCCMGITLLISIIFTIFNILISRASLEASMLLDSKRTYVRFISHEIR